MGEMTGPLADDALILELQSRGVHFDKRIDPTLERIANGKLRLCVCRSFSYDPGYSTFYVGEGLNLDECIANLHDDLEFDV